MDRETQKIYSEGETVSDYITSKGWKVVKDIFSQKILDLQSIKNLPKGATATILTKEIAIREAVVDILLEIIKEVEGKSEQFDGNKDLMTDVRII